MFIPLVIRAPDNASKVLPVGYLKIVWGDLRSKEEQSQGLSRQDVYGVFIGLFEVWRSSVLQAKLFIYEKASLFAIFRGKQIPKLSMTVGFYALITILNQMFWFSRLLTFGFEPLVVK